MSTKSASGPTVPCLAKCWYRHLMQHNSTCDTAITAITDQDLIFRQMRRKCKQTKFYLTNQNKKSHLYEGPCG